MSKFRFRINNIRKKTSIKTFFFSLRQKNVKSIWKFSYITRICCSYVLYGKRLSRQTFGFLKCYEFPRFKSTTNVIAKLLWYVETLLVLNLINKWLHPYFNTNPTSIFVRLRKKETKMFIVNINFLLMKHTSLGVAKKCPFVECVWPS